MAVSNVSEALKNISSLTKTPELTNACFDLQNKLKSNSTEIQDVIKKLSEFILNIDDVKLFKKYLSNILLALISAKIPLKPVFSSFNFDKCNDNEKICHLEYSIVLAELSGHPDILQYALKYFEINQVPPFEVFIHHEDSYNVAPKKRRLLDCRQKITDLQIVSCCYTLLNKLPNELSAKWDWTKFVSNFSRHEDAEIRWMVKECMVIITNMTEAQSKSLSHILNISEDICLQNISKNDTVCPVGEILKDTLGPNVVNIDGILLPIFEKNNVQNGNLVPVKSTVNNLRSLALAVASGQSLCLMGPVGSGKTCLVEHLAAITGRKGLAFKKVQLGDQTDSRMLLGSHQCTDIPGEFVWRPGVLTEAVLNGHWLLLEDIDSAVLDVASTLSSLLERNSLCVPGYRDSLPVTPGFQLFVTQRTLATNYGFQKKMSNSSTLLQKHLTQINVEPLSRSELGEIIQTLYPILTTICSRMIEVFMMFSVGSHDTSLETTELVINEQDNKLQHIRGSRLISTRDLLKWCSRAVVGFDVSSPESALKVLQDALDIFTCSVPSPDHRLELAKKVGLLLGIVETKSEFYCKHYKPNVSLNPRYLEVGRSKVPRVEKTLETIDLDSKQAVFSFTRQSACLLERIACCVTSNEPVLLVGETGTGKTSSVQYIAKQTGHKLIVINMNQQSDSADLLGGYKPVDLKYVIRPIRLQFENLFRSFYNVDKNQKFLGHIETCYETENWTALVTLMKQSHKAAVTRLTAEKKESILKKWLAFGHKLLRLEQQIKTASKLTFAFIEGSLVKAMQEGHWVLLDEINLASAEILECLAGLLEDKNETIDLLEKGDKVPIKRHPEFTLFACMNPATDVGKKDLPPGLRNRFTEFFIDELTERNDLMLLIGDYLYHMNLSGAILEAIYVFYTNIKKEAKLTLVDGCGNTPHYSLRTLCRALTAAAKAKCGTVSRSLYEAFCLSFLTQLDRSSHPKVEAMIAKAVLGKKNISSVINQMIPEPKILGQNYLLFEGHWIPQGKLEITIPEGYILTSTVKKNLRDIARIISLGHLPVLLQGDTSVGKTSLITYIAKASGNYCVRINNHEHTDLQEYIGSYATDSTGKLVFKEGVLVEAMRKGYWIILDELNLAPSDVLEALNRVLDDNRELFIPETQQVIKADPNFMLFATQNPPGLYGGRKMLSRAFRNRFVELHFDEIPKNELETILHQRCHIPPAYSKKMIAVMADLQIRRRGSAAVQGKDGFITLRDLFRWGQRYKHASKELLTNEKFYDWDQHIADEGYLILAGKVRQTDERYIIEQVIEKHIKRKVCAENLFSLHATTSPVTKHILESILNNQLEEFSHVVWTFNMRRLAVLIAKSFTFDEPVLLVGETGCGKTTICQVLATLKNRQLLSVNCHMHTESSDFLGGLRPVRQYKNDGCLFEWVDGPLIKAMESGNIFLADEISLADDSVLERMNSLLEPERQLVLAERGLEDNSDIVVITASEHFHFIGTMNPGGDFGKKELSPALRNRFTEIWCDSVTSREDLLNVLEKSIHKGVSLGNQEDGSSGIGTSILDFVNWLKNSEVTNKFPFSIRDLLSWVHFINVTVAKGLLDTSEAYVHGACMTFLDCFGTALTGHIEPDTLVLLRKRAVEFLLNQIKTVGNEYLEGLREMLSNKQAKFEAESDFNKFGIKPFYIEMGEHIEISEHVHKFTFTAPTTGANTLRLLRGLQLNKAILLEGNPGVGKTSLVSALAKSSGHKVIRINLSDQTDITDLFGTDLPTEEGNFAFKEGAFLNALQNGDWILLDELNLAPQPVLEGLNACLDHRGEIFIPELGRVFKVKPQTRIFACQNPLKQGGARRGLPISFLNRFTQVYIDTLTKEDLIYIVESQYLTISNDILHKIVSFNCQVAREIIELQSWGHLGAPFEMNLRDIQRWCEALVKDQDEGKPLRPGKYVDMLYVNRMRTADDKQRMTETYDKIFLPKYPRSDSNPQFLINDKQVLIGDVVLDRNVDKCFKNRSAIATNLLLLRNQLPTLKALAQSIKMNWLSILVGPTATGKSSIVQILADLSGNELHVVPVTSAMDVSDLLGGFEQVDYNRNLESLFDKIETLTMQTVRHLWLKQEDKNWKSNQLMSQLYQYKSIQTISRPEMSNDNMENFKQKLQFLQKHCEQLLHHHEIFDTMTNKIREVTSNLKKLQNKLAMAKSVNAGGKFEFVDSLLVKTMIEGSWLLLDNVNLTSAAVLDRLNGLLEPNGVLSIPERGDFSDITPHPNFRVFFTMDPKYGDISRAMRNRGVEIFLLRSNDIDTNLLETMSFMDLTALLSSCGLPCEYHEMAIKCHELMQTFVRGFERPTIANLLQAAHLSWQQIVRGINNATAFISSFSDVYIKPRCGGDFDSNVIMSLAEMKNTMLKALVELVNDESQRYINTSSTHHTYTVKGLCSNSSLEIAKQISYTAIQELLSLPLLFTLYSVYQKVPTNLLIPVHKIVQKSMNGQFSGHMHKLVKLLNDEACEYLNGYSDLQSHKRFYPEQYSLDATLVQLSNKESLLLFNNLMKTYLQSMFSTKSFSVLDFSKAVLSGNLTNDFVEYPILQYCQKYLDIIDTYILKSIKCSKDSLDDETTCNIIQALNWRHRFLKVSSEDIFAPSEGKRQKLLREDIVPLLNAHKKWLQKHLIQEFAKLSKENTKLFFDFNSSVNEIMPNSNEENTQIVKTSKKLRKIYGQPKLFYNKDEYELCCKKSELYSKLNLDMSQPLSKQMHKFSFANYSTTDMTMALDLPSIETLNLIEGTLSKSIDCEQIGRVVPQIKILPLISYVVQRIFTILQGDLSNIISQIIVPENLKVTSAFPEVLARLVDFGKVTKGLPPALLNIIELILHLQENRPDISERISSVPVKFWDEYYKTIVYSPAYYPLAFLLARAEVDEDTIEEVPVNTERFSKNVALLPCYLKKFTVSNDNPELKHLLAYEAVSMEERNNYSMQLGSVINILWKNIGTLDSAASFKNISDAKFEMKRYEKLISYIHAINVQNDDKPFEEISLEDIQVICNNTDSLTASYQIYQELKHVLQTNDFKMKILTAQLSLLTSFLLLKYMSEVSNIDHVEKYRLKSNYIEEDLKMFDTLLCVYYFQGLVSGGINDYRNIERPSDVIISELDEGRCGELKKVHPHCEIIMEMKKKTAEKISKYALGNTYRPDEPSYASFAKNCRHFTKSVLSSRTVEELMTTLIKVSNKLFKNYESKELIDTCIQDGHIVLKHCASWLYSINAFYKQVEKHTDAFPDIAKPLLSSLSQIIYSVTCLNDLIKEYITKIDFGPHLVNVVENLLVYPNKIPIRGVSEEYLNRFTSDELGKWMERIVNEMDGRSSAEFEHMQTLKMNLLELRMHCTALDKVEKMTANAVVVTLNEIVKVWEKQQQDIEKKKQDDEALYVTKSKCEDEDDEAIAQKEVQEMFPSYSDLDFAEFKPLTLEQKPEKPLVDKPKQNMLIGFEDVTVVYKWHSNLVRTMTSAEWLPPRKKLVGNDVISPLLQRYPTFSRVMNKAWRALDAEIEGTLSPSFMVLLSQIKAKVDGEESSSKVDFYRSAWVSETKQCIPLLHRVKESTNMLLDQWPDFPTLKEIMVIVNRILSFSVTSPVSRFLTGLELLRDKIEEWNKNAHKGNNLIDISLAVGQQIINWRKLEMAHWKECLNNLYYRKQCEAHKYWFFMYSVIESYIESSTEQPSTESIITVLRDFMEKSNLAEYEVRLDIIFVYHCHLIHLEQSPLRDKLLAILWNTYNYYAQFSAQIASHIKEKRTPIEKKLRDFVKICTWDRDLSYWSVKDTVEKAHKALHKHTKEFENVLKESVSSCLVDNTAEVIGDHVGIWDRPKRATTASALAGGAYMIDVTNHLVLQRNIKLIQKYLDEAEKPNELLNESGLLTKVPSLLNKARNLCKDAINNTAYPTMVQALDDFVTTIIETSTHLGSLEVDASLPKEKQVSQAKNYVQQKRKALADLFKYLTKLGLNYRTGLVIVNAGEELYDLTIPPVDLEAAVNYMKSRRCDASLSLLWSGCEKYFQKNIARHRTLALALQQPHQDLGIQNIERSKGFAAHLLKLTNTQKKSISINSRHLCVLRTLTTSFMNVLDIDSSSTNLSNLKIKLDILTECYAITGIALEQFNVLLKSCPEKGINQELEPDFDFILSDSKITRCYKNSDEWKDLYNRIKAVLSNVNKQKNALQKLNNNMPQEQDLTKNPTLVLSQNHIDVSNDCKMNLENIAKDIDNILQDYEFKFKLPIYDCNPRHPVLNTLIDLSTYLKSIISEIQVLDVSKNDNEGLESLDTTSLIQETEDLIATMLLIIQTIYKKHLPKEDKENADVLDAIDEIIKSDKEDSKDIVEDKHLKEHLEEKLSSDSKMLQLELLMDKTQSVLAMYVKYLLNGKEIDDIKSVMMRLVPILEQTVLFVQYFITQKVAVHRVSCKMLSVLLKIFTDLASKGFCKPSDLDMEEGEGEGGPGKLSGGMGLGDGEGQKDVSDRIENQDQLDDAQRPGEEKKEENRDCKEEEKGVNMTDDFDSHLQDIEEKEGEQSDKEDDEDDADKQMGDTDNAAEKLDQQIWGSEDEEEMDEEQNQKKDKEEKGKGESTGEKEMGAKDQQEENKDDGTQGKDKQKKKDINEMDEPEVDDDHVDPYHGNQQPMPEPEDFELPDNMDVDGEEPADEKEGDTETENPFDIDVMKENIPEEDEKTDDKGEEGIDNKAGLEVSSDEEGDGNEDDGNEGDGNEDTEEQDSDKNKENADENMEQEDGNQDKDDNSGEIAPEEPEQESAEPDVEEKEDKELPKNPDKVDQEDEVEQKNQNANPQANPSNNDPSAEDMAENAEMDRGTDDNVEINAEQQKDEEAAAKEQSQEQVGEEKQSMGRSELDKSETGHRGEKQAANRADSSHDRQNKRENKPADTDQERTLGDINEKKRKQAQTLNVEKEKETEDGADNDDNMEKEADAYQHVKQAKKDDLQAIDAATKEQADEQPRLQQEDEQDGETMKEDEEIPMDVDNDDIEVQKSEDLKPEKIKEGVDKEKDKSGNKKEGGEEPTGETGVEVEGDKVVTANVPRGAETSYHTRWDDTSMDTEEISLQTYTSIRSWLNNPVHNVKARADVWSGLWRDSSAAARALCERLRLVLEPTGRSRRAGDFRTGRAINMRRVIPYIASHFRKDRIWLRRTKPAKREYKIAIAIDDSSSMSDNRSKELAFESLALVSQALNLLESGELSVLSFGEKPNLLHPFSEQFTEHSGSKILEQMRFEQTKTKIAQLLDFTTVMFDEQTIRSDAVNAKLLVIVSDGRGIFSEGETKVIQAVRRARQQGIFLVYVIIDNPDNKDSIMDIRRPMLDPVTNSLTGFVSYLDTFPFPFYLILRDMSALPTVLGDALRQWFELAANTS